MGRHRLCSAGDFALKARSGLLLGLRYQIQPSTRGRLTCERTGMPGDQIYRHRLGPAVLAPKRHATVQRLDDGTRGVITPSHHDFGCGSQSTISMAQRVRESSAIRPAVTVSGRLLHSRKVVSPSSVGRSSASSMRRHREAIPRSDDRARSGACRSARSRS